MPDSSAIVSKVWNFAHVLKNAGVGYGDYVEQITYLLFLKLVDEGRSGVDAGIVCDTKTQESILRAAVRRWPCSDQGGRAA